MTTCSRADSIAARRTEARPSSEDSRSPHGGHRRAWSHRGHAGRDRKSTRLNSSHLGISYAVFCLKKKKNTQHTTTQHLCLATHQERSPAPTAQLTAHQPHIEQQAHDKTGRCVKVRSMDTQRNHTT